MNKSNDNGNGNKPTKLPNRNRESVSKNNRARAYFVKIVNQKEVLL